MITVKLYGKIRSDSGLKVWTTDQQPKDINALLALLSSDSGVELAQLKTSVIYVDGVFFGKLKMFNTKLEGVGEVALLSPVAGG